MGQTGHEDQTGVDRLEQKRHECLGHDLRAGKVHVVGLVEAVAERDFTGEEFEVEGGPWEMLVRMECHGIYGGVHTSVVDKDVNVPWPGLDLLESLLDRLVAGDVNLDRFNDIGRRWTFCMKGLDRKLSLL